MTDKDMLLKLLFNMGFNINILKLEDSDATHMIYFKLKDGHEVNFYFNNDKAVGCIVDGCDEDEE